MALMSNLPALGEGEEIDPQATALAYFIDKGYTPQQAAGIVGNLIQESGAGLNTTAVHDGGTGFGIAGFRDPTPGQGRKTNLLNFAKGSGADPRDLFTQLDFVHKELQGSEGAANRNLLRASDPAAAATAFAGYERPQGWSAANPMGAHGIQNRIGNAQALAPLAGQLATAGEGQEIEVNDAPIGGRAFAAGKGIMGGSGAITGSAGSDTLTGSGGSDRFTGGLASKPYQPGDQGDDIGSVLGAIGMSLLSGTRQNPMGNLPAILNAQAKDRQTAENQRYQRWRDERDYGTGRADKETAQKQWEASFGLQKTSNELAQARESRADQIERERLDLAKNADKRAETQAGKPDVLRGPGNSVMERQEDGTYVTKVPGERAPTEYQQRLEAGKALGLTGRDLQTFALTGKYEGPNSGANPYANPNGAKTTAEQDKSSGFADRMIQNEATLRPLESMGTSRNERGANAIPVIGSYFTSDEFKKYQSAKDNWIAAQLRKESGAAIGAEEYAAADRQYFPQINDPPSVLEQKRKLRQTATEGMMRDGGPGYQPKSIFHPETGEIVPFKRPGAAPAAQSNFDITAIPEDARRAEARRRGLIQ